MAATGIFRPPHAFTQERHQGAGMAAQDNSNDDAVSGAEQPAGAVAVGENICPTCSGRKTVDGKPCPTCEGSGKVIEPIGGA